MKKTRTEITIEIDELMLVKSRRGGSVQIWCPVCATEVMTLTPEQASAMARVSVRTINRWVEAEMVHFSEAPSGLLFICLDSLRGLLIRGNSSEA